ncbi:hypothetical protein WMF04_35090 [Sorangium sp. So ce260]|uniref:hypothetical protein n=1 Tax=Sorangium sp. So ce260 TaxID=3133291 RepID=UPI003F6467D7
MTNPVNTKKPKTVTVTLTGRFSNRAASIDGVRLTLAGVAGGPQSATRKGISEGPHTLSWSVNGEPGASYNVSISGDTDAWEHVFNMTDRGIDDGNKVFTVK